MKQFVKTQVDDRALMAMQDSIAENLNPLLRLPLNNMNLLQGVDLVSGANVIDHKLGRKLLGWFYTRSDAGVTIYDAQSTNATPALTLVLMSSGTVKVDLIVF